MSNKLEYDPWDSPYLAGTSIITSIFILIWGIFCFFDSFKTQKNTFLNLNNNMQSMWIKSPELTINDPKMLKDLAEEYRFFSAGFAKFNRKIKRCDLNFEQIYICKKMVFAASRFQRTFVKHPDFSKARKNDKDFEYKFEALSQSIIEANQTVKDWEIEMQKNEKMNNDGNDQNPIIPHGAT